MNRLLVICLMLSVAFSMTAVQAHPITVTEADNGKSVTLSSTDTLTVDLSVNTIVGYTWYAVYDPNGPLRLVGKQSMTVGVGMGSGDSSGTMSNSTWEYFYFKVANSAGLARHGYLNLLRMRNEPGVGGHLWHIRYTIKAAQ